MNGDRSALPLSYLLDLVLAEHTPDEPAAFVPYDRHESGSPCIVVFVRGIEVYFDIESRKVKL